MPVVHPSRVQGEPTRAVRCLTDLAWKVEQRLTARHALVPWRMPPGLACREGRVGASLCRLSTRVAAGNGPLARVLVASLDDPSRRSGVLSVLAVPDPASGGRVFGLEVRALGERIALLAVDLLPAGVESGARLPRLERARAQLERAGRLVEMPGWLAATRSRDAIAIRARSDRPTEIASAVADYAAAFVDLIEAPGDRRVDPRAAQHQQIRLGSFVAERVRTSRPIRRAFGGGWVDRYVEVVLGDGNLLRGRGRPARSSERRGMTR